jgi:hypothetical protein
MPPYGTPPIQPSSPPAVYCAECGCEVDPVAWLCATCGRNLHEPEAMSSMRPFATATSKDKKHGRSLKERIFIVLLVATVAIVIDAVEWHRRFNGGHGHIPAWILILDSIGLLFTLWINGFFITFDLW